MGDSGREFDQKVAAIYAAGPITGAVARASTGEASEADQAALREFVAAYPASPLSASLRDRFGWLVRDERPASSAIVATCPTCRTQVHAEPMGPVQCPGCTAWISAER